MLRAVTPPSFAVPLFIPNHSSLTGGQVAAQVIWVDLATTVPLRATNGVLMTLGR